MAHVRYNKILTHSHTTPGLSCHFSIYIFLFWGGGGGAQSLLGIATLLANLGIMLILLYIVGEKFCCYRFY